MHYDSYESKEMEKFIILNFGNFPTIEMFINFNSSLEFNHHYMELLWSDSDDLKYRGFV